MRNGRRWRPIARVRPAGWAGQTEAESWGMTFYNIISSRRVDGKDPCLLLLAQQPCKTRLSGGIK